MSFIQGTSIFELHSSLQLTEFVDQLLEPFKKRRNFYIIKLGLHEALVNAVKHGNNLDPHKKIKVKRIITPNWCVWQIQDQGDGLQQEKRIFHLPKRVDSINGRGLYIIRECFDDVRWSPKGNTLQLALKR